MIVLADQMFEILKEIDPNLKMKYNKFYIGVSKDGQGFNFVYFRPRKNCVNLHLKIEESTEIDERIEQAGLDTLEYNKRSRDYRIRLKEGDVENHKNELRELMRLAYENRVS